MLVSFIIPVFGQWELTKNCLYSLKLEVHIPFEVILIDNGANVLENDETRIEAPILGKKLFGDKFVYLPQEQNINFAGASNLGAKVARAPLLFFLNNDTVVQKDFLAPLLEAMQSGTRMKMVAPLLEYPNHTIQHLGVYFSPDNSVGHLYEKFQITHRVAKRKRNLQCITGAAFIMTKNDFFEVGAFNEGFRNGFEDVELCDRMKKNNAEFIIEPKSLITHYCSQSIGRHDNNIHNSNLLKETATSFIPDQHIFLENDGYRLYMTDRIKYIPGMSEKLNNSFKSIIEENNLNKMLETYKNEPYWHEGLYSIIKHKDLEKNHKAKLIISHPGTHHNKELLIELFHSTDDVEIKKIVAKFIAENIADSRKERIDRLHAAFDSLKTFSNDLALQCQTLIISTPKFLEELDVWVKKTMPTIENYL